jgi:hypothetical protein
MPATTHVHEPTTVWHGPPVDSCLAEPDSLERRAGARSDGDFSGVSGAEVADLSTLPIVPPVEPAWARAELYVQADNSIAIRNAAMRNTVVVGYLGRVIGELP